MSEPTVLASTRVVELHSREANADVVAFLEQALEMARAGEITGIALLVDEGKQVRFTSAGLRNVFAAAGYLNYMAYRMIRDDA